MHVPTKPMLAGSEAMSGRHCDGEIGEIMYLRSLCFYAEHCLYAQAHTHTPFSAHARMCSCLCARVRVSVLVRVQRAYTSKHLHSSKLCTRTCKQTRASNHILNVRIRMHHTLQACQCRVAAAARSTRVLKD